MNSHRDFNNFEMMGVFFHIVIFLDRVLEILHGNGWGREKFGPFFNYQVS